MMKPNDYGLFDMQGNAWQWCDNNIARYDVVNDRSVLEDSGYPIKVGDKDSRVMRGGSFDNPASDMSSAHRGSYLPSLSDFNFGFRAARTLP